MQKPLFFTRAKDNKLPRRYLTPLLCDNLKKKCFSKTFFPKKSESKNYIPAKLKLILFHQESRTLENHNMFKFRALLGKPCLHKKGKQQTYLKCTAQYV
jgi:hypothetical protein